MFVTCLPRYPLLSVALPTPFDTLPVSSPPPFVCVPAPCQILCRHRLPALSIPQLLESPACLVTPSLWSPVCDFLAPMLSSSVPHGPLLSHLHLWCWSHMPALSHSYLVACLSRHPLRCRSRLPALLPPRFGHVPSLTPPLLLVTPGCLVISSAVRVTCLRLSPSFWSSVCLIYPSAVDVTWVRWKTTCLFTHLILQHISCPSW